MKKYVYKEAYPEKVFRGVFKEETGLEPFTEASELDIVRKFLLKDLLRNHKIPLSRAKLIIDSIFRLYDTLISAFGVSNSLLTTMLTKVDNIVDKLQSAVSKRGGDIEPQEESSSGNLNDKQKSLMRYITHGEVYLVPGSNSVLVRQPSGVHTRYTPEEIYDLMNKKKAYVGYTKFSKPYDLDKVKKIMSSRKGSPLQVFRYDFQPQFLR